MCLSIKFNETARIPLLKRNTVIFFKDAARSLSKKQYILQGSVSKSQLKIQ